MSLGMVVIELGLIWTWLKGQCQDRFVLCNSGITMDLDWLKDFLALAEQGNFSRAADLRNITQPAFSRRIRALEDWIGAPLFVRGAQGATLTSAGVHFHPLADDMMRALDRARRDTRAVGERPSTALSIAATHALSFTFFPGWIRRHVKFDAIGTLNLISDSMDACEQIMLSGEVHFLLCHHHDSTPARFDSVRFPSARLGGDTLVAVCAPDAHGQPEWSIPGTTKRSIRVLSYSPESGLGRILAAHQSAASVISGAETVFTSHLAVTLMTMAREGHGVAWLPMTLADDDLKSGRLIRAGSDANDISVDIRLFRSPDCRSHAADQLWSVLTEDSHHV